ncbi:chondroitinase-B domain-containing protein [Flavivirga sp. 57AJ16]|uniref:chondroitinase-B domain-containing protein n=1 Tax=Flavivirga sp. 57AJ16 TaxID=3025307 RepID=UPI002365C141|nr:chondroitinase-B domain-containing protein [Flavivirga sp. 57AJ16]MDD7887524.1 chondroitinase-B domain-containing protein [Flavivirga sp. 57AJ16]
MKTNRDIILGVLLCLCTLSVFANDILVGNNNELKSALENAKPGDVIVMADKIWTDVSIKFSSKGLPDKPIKLKAQTPGKVILNGTSRLLIYGENLEVEGLWFKEGNTEGKAVISFKKNANELAKYCRVTNCAITNYNPSDRSIQYQWIELWGKNNRVDHSSFFGKTNRGPVLIVGLKGNPENYENNHRIDKNYFGFRPALGSNGGETIRIGTSHTAMESSRTIVEENVFEHCNGEVEIISNKTCDNIIRNNLFLESEGVLTLRHGNRCLVEGNVFFGNNKPHTGGIRVINEGHLIQNNLMIGLTGDGFRGPLVIMNGVPNGPANRYNQVKDVLIQNNTFINCSPLQLCEGSDTERTATPENTIVANNLFYGTKAMELLDVSDDISGITFSGNKFQGNYQVQAKGFSKVNLAWDNIEFYSVPSVSSDSILEVKPTYRPLRTDLTGTVRTQLRAGAVIPGNKKLPVALTTNSGVLWELQKATPTESIKPKQAYKVVKVAPGENTLVNAIKKARDYNLLELQEGEYIINRPMQISSNMIINGAGKGRTIIKIAKGLDKDPFYFFKVTEGSSLEIKNLEIDGTSSKKIRYAIVSQNTPTSNSYKLKMDDVFIHGFNDDGGAIFKAYKGTFADTIQIKNSRFENALRGLNLGYEKDDVGKYNAEVIDISNTIFKDIEQFAINFYRGGNDESTLGGQLNIDHCVFYNVYNNEKGRALRTNGIVYVTISNSIFAESPFSKYSAILKGVNNKVLNTVVYNSGELRVSSKAKLENIIYSNPKWSDRDTFLLKDNSQLKNAASDGKDIGIID